MITETEQNDARIVNQEALAACNRAHRSFLVLEFAKAVTPLAYAWSPKEILSRAEAIADEYLKRFPTTLAK